jgi:hypothetical protein
MTSPYKCAHHHPAHERRSDRAVNFAQIVSRNRTPFADPSAAAAGTSAFSTGCGEHYSEMNSLNALATLTQLATFALVVTLNRTAFPEPVFRSLRTISILRK